MHAVVGGLGLFLAGHRRGGRELEAESVGQETSKAGEWRAVGGAAANTAGARADAWGTRRDLERRAAEICGCRLEGRRMFGEALLLD